MDANVNPQEAPVEIPQAASVETDAITPLIQSDLKGYLELIDILGKERRLLVSREFDELTEVLANKHTLVTRLENNHKMRIALLNHSSLPISKDGIKILIAEQSLKKEQTLDDRHRVYALIEEASKLNEINAKITHRAQSTTSHILNILRGQGTTAPNLYSKNGTSNGKSSGLPIASA